MPRLPRERVTYGSATHEAGDFDHGANEPDPGQKRVDHARQVREEQNEGLHTDWCLASQHGRDSSSRDLQNDERHGSVNEAANDRSGSSAIEAKVEPDGENDRSDRQKQDEALFAHDSIVRLTGVLRARRRASSVWTCGRRGFLGAVPSFGAWKGTWTSPPVAQGRSK